jgi:hypothetical protein
MEIIDQIKVEEYLIAWRDDSYPQEPFYARFGILETIEQHTAQNEGCMSGDREWIEFDENIFYWISAFSGEKIEDHTKDIANHDFYYVGGETDE